jgi:CheY-like chemotaxis protein
MTRILSVDDEPINLLIIAECLADDGYQIDEAEDGEAAWSLICQNKYDLIILDRMMPRLDGISLLRRLKADPTWQHLPVIMQTAAASQNEVREGLEAGAHYYLTKPYDPEALRILVSTVLKDQGEREEIRYASNSLHSSLVLLEQGEFVYRTLHEAHDLAAALSSLCLEKDSASVGLIELLVNAVEHGNLGISYSEKSALRKGGTAWEEEIARRLTVSPYAERRVRVSMRREGDSIELIVRDEGAGFDWKPFLDFDPVRAYDLNGRGIAMANKFAFSSLEYRGNGNTVVARALARPPLE